MQVLRVFFDGLGFKVLELGFRVLLLQCKDFVVTFKVVVQRFMM